MDEGWAGHQPSYQLTDCIEVLSGSSTQPVFSFFPYILAGCTAGVVDPEQSTSWLRAIWTVDYLIREKNREAALAAHTLDRLAMHESDKKSWLNPDKLLLLAMATRNGANFGRLWIHSENL
jgi:hypothetical protein